MKNAFDVQSVLE